ncbi:hypothetical protein EON63_01040 [archaeon]|nr:MAG: hypothetical protein EON63_01040 [archaeon]
MHAALRISKQAALTIQRTGRVASHIDPLGSGVDADCSALLIPPHSKDQDSKNHPANQQAESNKHNSKLQPSITLVMHKTNLETPYLCTNHE